MRREIGSFAIVFCFMPLFLEREGGENRERGITRFMARLTVAIPKLRGLLGGQIVRYCIFPR